MGQFWNLMSDRLELRDQIAEKADSENLFPTHDFQAAKAKCSGTDCPGSTRAQFNIWQTFFPDVTDLHQYSRIRDATPRSFYNTLWLLALANVGVIALEQCGVLLVESNRQEAAEARLTSMIASPKAPEGVSLASIDLDGDGFFSSRDVA